MNVKNLLPALALASASLFASCGGNTKTAAPKADAIVLATCPTFVADSAFRYIQEQCAFGPRLTGSQESALCCQYIQDQFTRLGAKVQLQESIVTIYDGTRLKCKNIIASLNPDNPDRILFCSHWDSRPWADNDPDERNHYTPIDGANDGASGVGVLLEVARQLKQQQPAIGIDIVFFDAEDYGIHSADEDNYVEDTWCLGSQYWARQAAKTGYMARYGILLDMVGAPNARFCQERLSRQYAAAIVDKVWHTAHAIGYGQYFPITPGSYVTDDHLPLNDVAHIPTIDIIPYDEEYGFGEKWHTVGDNMEWIDPATLHAVGQTILQVIYNEK